MTQTYICRGSVRGDCGHQHRTMTGAARCLRRDQSGCGSQGGYSDRRIVRGDGSAVDDVAMTQPETRLRIEPEPYARRHQRETR